MLGEMHWEGLGGPRDRALGYAWMDLAAERYYEDFYLLRERYWSQLGAQEREQALRRGQPLLRKYGDDKAKRRLARILVRERPDQLAIGGFFGNFAVLLIFGSMICATAFRLRKNNVSLWPIAPDSSNAEPAPAVVRA